MTEKLERKDPRFKKIQITVDAYLPQIVDEDGFKEGLLTFFAFSTDVLNPENEDEKLGTIGGGLGSVVLIDKEKGGQWMIHHDDLWFAFQKALENEEHE